MQIEFRFSAERAGERGINKRKAGHRALALESDLRRLLIERTVRNGAEVRCDVVERALLDMDVARFERAFRDRA